MQGFFFESVKIESGGNICADYFMNCELYARNIIRALGKKGSLVGGFTCADGGVKVTQLGNQAGIPTYIKLGMGEKLMLEEQQINDKINSVNEELLTLTRAHKDYVLKFSSQIRNLSDLYIKVGNTFICTDCGGSRCL